MVYSEENLRMTTAGLVLCQTGFVKGEEKYKIGLHWPRKAFENDGVKHLTTVGGGIEPGELPLRAMKRELAEEYGVGFAKRCSVEPLDLSLSIKKRTALSTSGLLKCYDWFKITVRDQHIEPVLNTLEVVNFGWHTISSSDQKELDVIAHYLGAGKRQMLQSAIKAATGIETNIVSRVQMAA